MFSYKDFLSLHRKLVNLVQGRFETIYFTVTLKDNKHNIKLRGVRTSPLETKPLPKNQNLLLRKQH